MMTISSTRQVNADKNKELNFIVKQVASFVEGVFKCSKVRLLWDETSNIYQNCTLNVQRCRHDIIILANDGTEVGTGEVKPPNATSMEVDIDRCRVAESLKKQLNKRLLLARSYNELYTFGLLFYGENIELSTMNLTSDGSYDYCILYEATLPTCHGNSVLLLLSETKAYGAKQRQSSSECKNSARSIGSTSKVQRKQLAENADLSFRYISHELFCLEIGLTDNGPNDTKELNESSIKTPMMMKNFCSHLISQYKMNPNKINIMGIIISGYSIKALGMSFNNGSTSLLSISDRFHMPETVSEIPRLLPPVLNLVYVVNF